MRDLESHRIGPRRTMAPAPAPAPTSDSAVANSAQPIDPSLKPEGAVLISRRGRLVRLAEQGGRLALVFDNDPDSPGPKPFVLHPCQLLERLESVASARGDDTTFRVSGRVTVFEGRNYLLPTFEQAIVQTDISPMQ